MEMIITTIEGYTIVYSTRDKKFYLKDSEDEIVGQSKTQDEIELQAKKLAKSDFKPIAALRCVNLALDVGRVTSVNLGDWSVRFCDDDRKNTMKVNLRYSGLYKLTEHNQLIKNQVDGFLAEAEEIEERIRDLMKRLEKPINLEYFNLTR